MYCRGCRTFHFLQQAEVGLAVNRVGPGGQGRPREPLEQGTTYFSRVPMLELTCIQRYPPMSCCTASIVHACSSEASTLISSAAGMPRARATSDPAHKDIISVSPAAAAAARILPVSAFWIG